jgi:putative hemolysin
MKKILIAITAVIILIVIFIFGYKISGSNKLDNYLPFFLTSDGWNKTERERNSKPTTLANPASEFCIKAGGVLEKVVSPQGESNNCTFSNGEKCDEWTLFRGECNISGVSNTGIYSNDKNVVTVIYRIFNNTALLNAPDLNLNNIELVSAISASGARYLSLDGKIEFWEHQGEGTLSVAGQELFRGPITEKK